MIVKFQPITSSKIANCCFYISVYVQVKKQIGNMLISEL